MMIYVSLVISTKEDGEGSITFLAKNEEVIKLTIKRISEHLSDIYEDFEIISIDKKDMKKENIIINTSKTLH